MPGFVVGGYGAGAPDSFQPYMSWTWRIDQLMGSGVTTIMPKDCSLPTFAANTELVEGTALAYQYASGIKWDPIQIVFYDTVGLLKKIQEWRNSIWSPETGLQPASEYKKQSIITQFLEDDTNEVTWTLYNSWPSYIKYGELTYTDSVAKVVAVTLSYDWAAEGFDSKPTPPAAANQVQSLNP